jgi:hypothetical protein
VSFQRSVKRFRYLREFDGANLDLRIRLCSHKSRPPCRPPPCSTRSNAHQHRTHTYPLLDSDSRAPSIFKKTIVYCTQSRHVKLTARPSWGQKIVCVITVFSYAMGGVPCGKGEGYAIVPSHPTAGQKIVNLLWQHGKFIVPHEPYEMEEIQPYSNSAKTRPIIHANPLGGSSAGMHFSDTAAVM